MANIENRYDFVLYFDVENGNPNGDPDSGNMPRIDAQTAHGIVTDVCIKRKVRNYIQTAYGDEQGYDIFITEGAVLNNKLKQTYEDYNIDVKDKQARDVARKYMCERFYDVRTFGAVMDTGDYKAGQVRGPAQFCFARSVDPVFQQEITITRMASTKEDDDATKNRTMGRKYVVPYGLYRMEGFITPAFAQKTGFVQADLDRLWQALLNMFEIDRSAARGKMAVRGLVVFRHDTALGNAPAHQLFGLVTAARKDVDKLPRSFDDYIIAVGDAPQGVTIQELC
ncbi:MAG: type I-C CRISPR-associated protein Cas7/Csd2 [Eubacteriales bacterium]|nr:type I-C CRISPR-associated protein Cas7/Csd2 [Eubacteriales bacterium]